MRRTELRLPTAERCAPCVPNAHRERQHFVASGSGESLRALLLDLFLSVSFLENVAAPKQRTKPPPGASEQVVGNVSAARTALQVAVSVAAGRREGKRKRR
ncbi:unnamed protein product [Pleuronectes platessa]|uniref:Uncharacterized protein n=1 Tax=Pleuronectes platessa TaxID=8262 RepID=A0A9N7V357_PLEPL|nr:unnamed protein product [Pleuronectes platessa]